MLFIRFASCVSRVGENSSSSPIRIVSLAVFFSDIIVGAITVFLDRIAVPASFL